MAAKPVTFHDSAFVDYEEAFEWYFSRSETAAARFVVEVERAIDEIAHGPERWIAGPFHSRKFFLRGFPFTVIYRDFAAAIQALAVAHGRRKPGYRINRLR